MFRLFLVLFVIRSVHLAPAKHTYEGVGGSASQRINRQAFNQAVANSFRQTDLTQGQIGLQQQQQIQQQQGLGQQSFAQYPTASGSATQFGGLASTGFGVGQSQGFSQNGAADLGAGLGQNLGAGFDQNLGAGLNQNSDDGLGQNLGAGFNQNLGDGFNQNLGAGLNQNLDAGLGQNSAAGLGQNLDGGFNQNLGTGLNQNLDAGLGRNLGGGFNQNLGAGLNQNLDAGLGQNLGDGFDQNSGAGLNQNLGTAFGQNFGTGLSQNLGAGLNQNLNSGFNQNFGAGLNQNFGGGLDSNLGTGLNQNLGLDQQAFGQQQAFTPQPALTGSDNFGETTPLPPTGSFGTAQNLGVGQAGSQDQYSQQLQGPQLGQGQTQNAPLAPIADFGNSAQLNQLQAGFGQQQQQQDLGLGQSFDQGFQQQDGFDNGQAQQQVGGNGGINAQISTAGANGLEGSFAGGTDDQQNAVQIGGKPQQQLLPPQQQQQQQQQQFSDLSNGNGNNEDADGPLVTKDFYLHAAPEEIEDDEEDVRKIQTGPSRKHFNVIFIRAPSPSAKSVALKLLQAQKEEKTVIYVLSKSLDSAEIRTQIKQLPSHVSKPEVFFIKYRTPEEAQFAQQKIQAQFDALGGTSRLSDEGISPITSVVGALQGEQLQPGDQQQFDQQNQDQQQNGSDQQNGGQQNGGQQNGGFNQKNGGQQNGGFNQQKQRPPFGRPGQFDQPPAPLTGQQQQFDQSQSNNGEGIIEPRIGDGSSRGIKPVRLDGDAIGRTLNFGAAGQPDSRILKKSRQLKPRH